MNKRKRTEKRRHWTFSIVDSENPPFMEILSNLVKIAKVSKS